MTNPESIIRRLLTQIPGKRLPSERDLAEQVGVSRPRLRAILAALQQEGLVESRAKSGTYAIDQGTHSLRRVALLIDEDLKLGDDPFFSVARGLPATQHSGGGGRVA